MIRDSVIIASNWMQKRCSKTFNPLFVLNYSATHKTKHDTIYALDALDAYRQKLVKRIHVKGFEVKNLKGTSSYLYLDNFIAETKGSMSSMELNAIENAKIACAKKLFNTISTVNVKYHQVATYQDLLDGMNAVG